MNSTLSTFILVVMALVSDAFVLQELPEYNSYFRQERAVRPAFEREFARNARFYNNRLHPMFTWGEVNFPAAQHQKTHIVQGNK